MRVLSVLLCFALAYGVNASIFKQKYHHGIDVDIQHLDYPHQKHNHHSGHKYSEQQVGNIPYQTIQKDYQEYSPSEQYNQQYPQQYSQSHEQYPNQEWNQARQQPQPEGYQPYQNPTRYNQYQPPSSAQHSHEQDKTSTFYQPPESSYDGQKPYHHSFSSESHSQESKEKRKQLESVQKLYEDSQKWGSSQHSSVQDSENTNDWDPSTAQFAHLKIAVGSNISGQEKESIKKIFNDAQNAMKHFTEEEKMKYHQALDQQQRNEEENHVILNATQLAQTHQYPVEEHTVRTDDGYQLTVFRIPPKTHPRGVQKSPVVFLMHGILGSADDWLVKGPQESLAYLLSDAGYDVWLGNARGNKYSQHHVSKSPAISDFWQYSTDEIALHDLPAMIDYALNATHQEHLYYVGHSLGNTIFFALAAARPEYNNKIKHMYALSPMVYMTNVRSPLIRMIAPTSKYYTYLQRQLGNGPFTPNKDLIRIFGGPILEHVTGSEAVGSHIYTVMAGFHAEDEDLATLPIVMQHIPAGTSSKVVKHYSQGVASQEFQRYDYGNALNQKVYGSEQPPKYDVQKVEAPVTLYYSDEDWLAHPQDVERLKNELPNVKETYKVPEQYFSNMDFQFSTKAPEIVYKRLIESMENNQ